MKVFFTDSSIYFPERLEEAGENLFIEPDEEKIKELIDESFSKSKVNIALFSQNRKELIALFMKNFHLIEAAGGLVRAKSTGNLFFIRHHGCWSLPKGWREEGETARENALREVREETGVKGLRAGVYLGKTRHAYKQGQDAILKETDWFAMECEGESYKLQSEEDITEGRFVSPDMLKDVLQLAHRNIGDVVELWMEKRR